MTTPPTTDATLLLDAARTLRAEAEGIVASLDRVIPYDRDDVWQGSVADAFREGLQDARRLLTHPLVGARAQLQQVALFLELRARAMQAATGATAPTR
jgi:hypothetical protein